MTTLSAIGAEPDARTGGARPFWLSEPCPSWCDATGHSNWDAYPDRRHLLLGAEVTLSLYDADEGPAGAKVEPLYLWMMAAQHYRAVEPDVTIVVPLPADRPTALVEHEIRITVAETRALRDGLTELLDALDAADQGR